jgi:hypothetical protein
MTNKIVLDNEACVSISTEFLPLMLNKDNNSIDIPKETELNENIKLFSVWKLSFGENTRFSIDCRVATDFCIITKRYCECMTVKIIKGVKVI